MHRWRGARLTAYSNHSDVSTELQREIPVLRVVAPSGVAAPIQRRAGAELRVFVGVGEGHPDDAPVTRMAALLGHIGRRRVEVSQCRGGDASWPLRLAQEAAAHACDLLLVGRDGHRRVGGVLEPEFAHQVVRHARMPVMAVAPGTRRLPRRVLVAVDFGRASRVALDAALSVADAAARLTLVYVRRADGGELGGGSAWVQTLRRKVDDLLEELRQRAAWRARAVDAIVVEGDPAEAVLRLSDRCGADLVAVPVHGESVQRRRVSRSIALPVLRSARGTVLLAPPAPRALPYHPFAARALSHTLRCSTGHGHAMALGRRSGHAVEVLE